MSIWAVCVPYCQIPKIIIIILVQDIQENTKKKSRKSMGIFGYAINILHAENISKSILASLRLLHYWGKSFLNKSVAVNCNGIPDSETRNEFDTNRYLLTGVMQSEAGETGLFNIIWFIWFIHTHKMLCLLSVETGFIYKCVYQ